MFTEERNNYVEKKMILKTRVKVSMYLLGQSSHVSDMANLKGTDTPMHVLKKWRKGRY